jgi:hypothetical protein
LAKYSYTNLIRDPCLNKICFTKCRKATHDSLVMAGQRPN